MKNNQYLKSLLSICFLCSILIFTSCSSKQLFNSDSPIDSSNGIDSSDNLDDETMFVASIPNEFICFGEIYTSNNEEIKTLTFGTMIGYLVNENELDFWKSKDNSNDLVYALATGNGMFRKTYEGEENLKDRYELYSQDETHDCLAIKGYTGDFKLFYRQGGNYENI